MAYAVLADLKSRLGSNVSPPGLYEQITDRTGGSVGSDIVGQEILDDAHGTLNAYLAGRYQVPVDVSADTTLAAFLKKAVLVLAEYGAWQTHPRRKTIPERVGDAHSKLVSLLNRIADGKAALPGEAAVPSSTSTGITGQAIGFGRKFTEDTVEDL